MDASKRAEYVKKIHGKANEELEKKAQYFAAKVNKHRKKITFRLGNMVWVHLRKEQFPKKSKSKFCQEETNHSKFWPRLMTLPRKLIF
jgi:hypothetical protein